MSKKKHFRIWAFRNKLGSYHSWDGPPSDAYTPYVLEEALDAEKAKVEMLKEAYIKLSDVEYMRSKYTGWEMTKAYADVLGEALDILESL